MGACEAIVAGSPADGSLAGHPGGKTPLALEISPLSVRRKPFIIKETARASRTARSDSAPEEIRMLDQLNRMVADHVLPLAPFNAEGVSVNPRPEGILFAAVDETLRIVRLYTNAAPLTDFVKSRPRLLLDLFTLSGPGSPWPQLRLGIDPKAGFVWASASVRFEDASAPQLKDALETFEREAAQVRASFIERINRAAGAPGEPAQSAPAAAADLMTAAQDLEVLIANPNVLWG